MEGRVDRILELIDGVLDEHDGIEIAVGQLALIDEHDIPVAFGEYPDLPPVA